MVKANELRLGNYINTDSHGVVKVYGVQKLPDYNIICISQEQLKTDYWAKVENTHPIPLTPEILEKAGFQKLPREHSGYQGFKFGDFELEESMHEPGFYYSCSNRDNDGNECSVLLQSVHQLQNLYHALTGEELDIKI